ncbi:MAG: right-handed parallel beta-helix repeat-containing protein [Bacteroidota bacterium]
MKNLQYIVILGALVIAFFNACRPDEEFTNDPAATLSFSLDTVYFDTLFTQLANGQIKPISITKQLRVTNTNKNAIRTNIRLAGNYARSYQLNIDGETTNQKYGKEILGKDSIIIFIQCYVDSNSLDSAFIVDAQMVFETNGNVQDVDLVGWGQNAKYYNNTVLDCNGGNLHWTSEKPYVIYDSILVPFGCTLTIDAGTRIHSYNNSCILVQGTLVVNGTPENPVIFEGTRLDGGGKDYTKQWIGIRFLPRSKDNRIKGAIIRNGFVGIEVDSLPVNGSPNLQIEQCRIYNMQAVGIVGYTSHIVAINNEITNCGQFGFFGALGGDYKLYHNTLALYNTDFNRQNPLLVFDNSSYKDANGAVLTSFPLSFELVNNIIEGSLEDEFLINDSKATTITAVIQNNIFRTKNKSLNVNGNKLNVNVLFENPGLMQYTLKAASPAKAAGANIGVTVDLKNKIRAAVPSMGCYE